MDQQSKAYSRVKNAYIRDLIGNLSGKRFLDYGCGAGMFVVHAASSGAAEVVHNIGRIDPARIVYVSCHPGTLARDAGVLVNDAGYTLEAAGIIDMFPHTAHVESIAVFSKQ